MIELKWLTVAAAKSMLSAVTSPYPRDVLKSALASAPTAREDEHVALFALYEGRLAGWMWFTYGIFSDNGVAVRAAAAQNLYTIENYRGLGVGTSLIDASCRCPMYCVYSGISAAAMPLYLKLGFSFFDEWPIYRLPLGGWGVVRNWRSDYYEGKNGISGALRALRRVRGERERVIRERSAGWVSLDGEKVADTLCEIARYRHRRFQVPWNLDAVDAAARGHDESMYAFVLENSGGERRYASIYVREEEVRIPLTGRRVAFRDGHLNEIYPPVEDAGTARALVAELARLARARGLGCLSIYASTPALEEVLTAWGLRRQQRRILTVKPPVLDPQRPAPVQLAENWWCRALNEEQVEETARSTRTLG